MRRTGLILIALGIIAVLVSFLLPTSVTTYGGGPYSSAVPERVANLAMLQRQMMVFEIGLAATIAGVFLFVGGVLASRPGGAAAAPQAPSDATGGGAAGFSRREVMIGAALLAGIALILAFVGLSGQGSGPTVDSNTVAYEEMNELDESLYPEESAATAAARRREEARRVAEAPVRNDAAPAAPAPVAEPATPASDPPTGNVTVPEPVEPADGNRI